MKGLLDDDTEETNAEAKAEAEAEAKAKAEEKLRNKASPALDPKPNSDFDNREELAKKKLFEALAGSRAGELLEESHSLQTAKGPDEASKSEDGEQPPLFKDELSLQGKIEALLFATPNPLRASDLFELLYDEETTLREVSAVAEQMLRYYRENSGGFKLVHIQGKGYQFQTVPMASYLMERMFSQKPRPLSRAAHETLAIIAYRQPVTRANIEFIRGVDAGSIIKNLLERQLIHCVGRKESSPGKPMVFGTTEEFLKTYRIANLGALPPLESFQPSRESMSLAEEKIESKSDVNLEELLPSPGHATPMLGAPKPGKGNPSLDL